ncbi:MAG: hypothetical protein V3S08_06900 [Phycisphaerales bacterium]
MTSAEIQPPYHPIIFVRGYAGTDAIVESTTATPYMGFNQGAVKLRQRWTGAVVRYVFESPLLRLMKEYGYLDAYRDGAEPVAGGTARLPARSVFVYRYYDEVADGGERGEIEAYASGLGETILRVRDLVCGDDQAARDAFAVHLVAHSMGGLICRTLLQNHQVSTAETRDLVDKVFTYGTPHNGIDVAVLGNVPGFFSLNNADNFNRKRMAQYLDLPAESPRVDTLEDRFDPGRFFCLIGTDDRDYAAGAGWTRRLVGPMSDGLVRIANAVVRDTPRAFVHRSHSGQFGMVNSEEGYQNLVRFLFGNCRVDGVLKVASLSLPGKVQRALNAGRKVRASYHFEVVVRTRGATWDLHRRTVGEQSAIFRTWEELFPTTDAPIRHPYLFSVFLSEACRVKARRPSLGFSVDLGVPVPEYEIDGEPWLDDHHDGGYLYRDKLNLEVTMHDGWSLRYGFDSKSPNRVTRSAGKPVGQMGDTVVFEIPIRQATQPGMEAQVELRVALG